MVVEVSGDPTANARTRGGFGTSIVCEREVPPARFWKLRIWCEECEVGLGILRARTGVGGDVLNFRNSHEARNATTGPGDPRG